MLNHVCFSGEKRILITSQASLLMKRHRVTGGRGYLRLSGGNLMVETGHFPSWPRMEMRRPCVSSSQMLSTVPALPSVMITALPISSVWACSNSPRIVHARSFVTGMMGVPQIERIEVGGGVSLKDVEVMISARQCYVGGTASYAMGHAG